jgi:hypothetical protein
MTGTVLWADCWDAQHISMLQLSYSKRRPLLWMLCVKLLLVRCVFVWNVAWWWSYVFGPRTCSCKFDAATNICLSGILVWYNIQRQLNVMPLNVKYSCIVWVPTLCIWLQYRTPSGLSALCRVYWDLWWGHSLWIEDTAAREKASVLLYVACMTTNWGSCNTARNFVLHDWNEDFRKERQTSLLWM